MFVFIFLLNKIRKYNLKIQEFSLFLKFTHIENTKQKQYFRVPVVILL